MQSFRSSSESAARRALLLGRDALAEDVSGFERLASGRAAIAVRNDSMHRGDDLLCASLRGLDFLALLRIWRGCAIAAGPNTSSSTEFVGSEASSDTFLSLSV